MLPIIEDTLKKQARSVIKEEIKDLFDLPTKGTLKSPERIKRKISRRKKIQRIKTEF